MKGRTLLALSRDAQRQAYAQWLANPAVQSAFDHKDWAEAYTKLGYPRRDLGDDAVPFAPAPRDLASVRLTLISSSGLSAPGQPPFDDVDRLGDYTWRSLPSDLDLAETVLHHEHYNHASGNADRNVVFPLDRLRELRDQGVIGGLTDQQFTVMGYQPDWERTEDVLAPELVEQVMRQRPDAALLIPV